MDRGLLLALMALQKEFITRQQFLTGFRAWLVNRFLKLEEILVQKAFLTKGQLERLSFDLLTMQERSQNEWQIAIRESQAVRTVYDDMVSLAANNAPVLQFVTMIGKAMSSPSSPTAESNTRLDEPSAHDPHSTIDSPLPLDPYATMITREFDDTEI